MMTDYSFLGELSPRQQIIFTVWTTETIIESWIYDWRLNMLKKCFRFNTKSTISTAQAIVLLFFLSKILRLLENTMETYMNLVHEPRPNAYKIKMTACQVVMCVSYSMHGRSVYSQFTYVCDNNHKISWKYESYCLAFMNPLEFYDEWACFWSHLTALQSFRKGRDEI